MVLAMLSSSQLCAESFVGGLRSFLVVVLLVPQKHLCYIPGSCLNVLISLDDIH